MYIIDLYYLLTLWSVRMRGCEKLKTLLPFVLASVADTGHHTQRLQPYTPPLQRYPLLPPGNARR